MSATEEMKQSIDRYTVIAVSTAHIHAADAERLLEMGKSDDHQMILSRDTGAFVKMYLSDSSGEERDIEQDFPGFSDAFYNVLRSAYSAGYLMVEFDSDADTYEFLEAFDW